MVSIRIQLRAIPGGWRLSVGRDDLRPVETDLEPASVHGLIEQIQALLRPPLVATSDVQRTRLEEQAGARMMEVFFSDRAVTAALHGWLGEARGAGTPALLVVDADDAGLRRLPWELLGPGEPFEAAGGVVVARHGTGQAASRVRGSGVQLIGLDADDELCATRTDHLRQWLSARGALRDEAAVVHLVAHGDRTGDEAWLALARDTSAGSAAHALHSQLEGASLVVLDICDAGAVDGATLAERLIRRGVGAVVAPRGRLAREAAEAFGEGLYTALFEGAPIAGAVAAGRRAVRTLASPHPDGRWSGLVLSLGGGSAAGIRLPLNRWQPDGWGLEQEGVRAWLEEARNRASAHGFVGLEHLLDALPEGGGRWAGQLRYQLAASESPLQDLRLLQPSEREPCWRGTPRLRENVPPTELDVEGLACWLCTGLDDAVSALLGSAAMALPEDAGASSTLEVQEIEASGTPATGVEMLGGPEDGRWFGSGAVVGRSSAGGEGVYRDCALTDPYLSRVALTLSVPPRLRKGAERSRGGRRERVDAGPVDLERNDVLWLTRATRLRAR